MISALLAAALVWVPPESFTQWSQVDALLRARPELKLTIALTPEMATPLAKDSLGPWAASGRVEIAARIHGDPVLPLVAAHPAAPRPDDALELAVEAREAVEKSLGTGPAGFVPGAGALETSLVDPLGASGAPWVLAGPYAAAGSTWAAAGPVVFVPARALPRGAPEPEESAGGGAFVVDESTQADSALIAALAAAPAFERDRATLAELIKAAAPARRAARDVAAWPDWNGAPAAAPADASARAAWDAYGEAARALARYQNSGAADLKVLESASALLRRAQEARFFRAAAPGAPAGLPGPLRARLIAVYRRIKSPAPESLYEAGSSTAAAADLPTGVHAGAGADWVAFTNPAGSAVRAPAGAANGDPWRLRGLRVEWNDERVLFRLQPARVDAVPEAPEPLYDVYIDLNHVIGAGSIRLLEGRGAFAQARDAWEFALGVDGGQAKLWRAGAGADHEELATLKVETDPAGAEIRIAVPRTLLRGNPSRWGYIVLSLADDPVRRIVGLLAPLDLQKTVADHPGAPQRVSAVRLETSPRP